jgi:hypothetical protein
MPSVFTQYHINQALASMSILPANPDVAYASRIGMGVARRPVDKVSNVYFIYGREISGSKSAAGAVARNLRSMRAPGAVAGEIDFSLSTSPYQCTEYALSDFVADAEIRDSDAPLSPILDAATNAKNWVMNDVEQVWAKICLDLTSYNASNKTTLVTGTTSWLAYTSATSDPLANIRAARKRLELILQRPPNTMILIAESARVLAEHPQIKDLCKYTEKGFELLGGEGLPPALRNLRIVVASAVTNTAAEGASYTPGYIALDSAGNDFALICYVPDGGGVGPRGVTSFTMFDAPDQTTNQRGLSVRSWRDEARKGWKVEAAQTVDFRYIFQDGSSLNTGAYIFSGTTL